MLVIVVQVVIEYSCSLDKFLLYGIYIEILC